MPGSIRDSWSLVLTGPSEETWRMGIYTVSQGKEHYREQNGAAHVKQGLCQAVTQAAKGIAPSPDVAEASSGEHTQDLITSRGRGGLQWPKMD